MFKDDIIFFNKIPIIKKETIDGPRCAYKNISNKKPANIDKKISLKLINDILFLEKNIKIKKSINTKLGIMFNILKVARKLFCNKVKTKKSKTIISVFFHIQLFLFIICYYK